MSKKKATKEAMQPEQVAEILNVNILHDMINNLEETKLKLLLNIKELKEKLSQQKEDQADIYYYLNKKCDESFEVIASLEEQIINEQTDREISEKLYESKIEELRTSASQNEAKYTSKIAELETKLEMLNSYNEEKQENDRQMRALMKQLEDEREQFRLNAESIENKFLIERDKLRKTYDIKYESIKKELESSVETKLSKKTKKTQIMNVVMKKELDNQSRHAEKLLELNSTIIERDKSLKLELELAHSLQHDMTMRLALAQRNIKELTDKVAEIEAKQTATMQDAEGKIAQKNETIIRLEAKLNQQSKKTAVENSKLDEMWHFLSSSYQLLKMRAGTTGSRAPALPTFDPGTSSSSSSAAGPGQLASTASTSSGKTASMMYDHEKTLVALVKAVATKHPKMLTGLMSGAASEAQQGQGSAFGVGARQGNEAGSSSSSTIARSATISGNDRSSDGSQWLSAAAAASSAHRHAPSDAAYAGSSTGTATGIPAWDMKTAHGEQDHVRSVRVRTVGVQTEGKAQLYPDYSSFSLQPPGTRSLLQQLQQDSSTPHTQGQPHRQVYAQGPVDPDSGSVGGYHSVNSLWGGEGPGGSSMSQISMDDATDAYSVKTSSHVLLAPAGNGRHARSKSSAVIAKMRKLNMQSHKPAGSASRRDGMEAGMGTETEPAYGAGFVPSLEGKSPHHSMQAGLAPPHIAHSPVQRVDQTQSVVLATGTAGGILSPMVPPLAYRQSHFIQRISQTQPPQQMQNSSSSLPANMSVSGQGFVAPLVLPKL